MTDIQSCVSIPPTIELHDANAEAWDAIIVGAGPAGAAAAITLAGRRGRVLLVDKASFPRWKVCGCCLSGWGLSALKLLGLEGLPSRVGAPKLLEMHLGISGAKAVLPMGAGVALSRESMDSALIRRAIELGASFLPGTTASILPANSNEVQLRRGEVEVAVRYKTLIIADGLGGRFLSSTAAFSNIAMEESHIGAGALSHDASDLYPSGTLAMAVGEAGYVGLVRLENGAIDLAAAISPKACRLAGGPGQAIRGVMNEARFRLPSDFETLDWRGTPRLTHRLDRVAAGRILVIGDAASYVEPFTGEGMSWAMWSGIEVAGIVADGLQGAQRGAAATESPGIRWERKYATLLRYRQRRCRAVSMLLRRPALRNAVVRSLSAMPWLARPIVRAIGHG